MKFFIVIVLSFVLLSLVILHGSGVRLPVVYNRTDSLPHGFYRIVKDRIVQKGDIVVFHIPDTVEELVVSRQWLRKGDYLMKPVIGMEQDSCCTCSGELRINGTGYGSIREKDGQGRRLPAWRYCGRIGQGLVVGVAGDGRSFDSRYFGAVERHEIIGIAIPLWVY